MTKTLSQQIEQRMNEAGLPDPEKEFRFHPERQWRFDFCWPGLMVALEVEGGTWAKGRHTRGKGYASDCEKYSEAAILGWMVIRVTGDMIKNGKAINLIHRAIEGVA